MSGDKYDPFDGLPDYSPEDIEALDKCRSWMLEGDNFQKGAECEEHTHQGGAKRSAWQMFIQFCPRVEIRRPLERNLYFMDARLRSKSFAQFKEEKEFERQRELEKSIAEKELAQLKPELMLLQRSKDGLDASNSALKTENEKLGKKVAVLTDIRDRRIITVTNAHSTIRDLVNENKGLRDDLDKSHKTERGRSRVWGLIKDLSSAAIGTALGAVLGTVGTIVVMNYFKDSNQDNPANKGGYERSGDDNSKSGNSMPKANFPFQLPDSVAITHGKKLLDSTNVVKKPDTVIKTSQKKSP